MSKAGKVLSRGIMKDAKGKQVSDCGNRKAYQQDFRRDPAIQKDPCGIQTQKKQKNNAPLQELGNIIMVSKKKASKQSDRFPMQGC